MKAVVMAGGEGTRLRPLTTHRPKPLAPVLNKPIMEHILVLLRSAGITEVVVTVHYLSDAIEGYFGDGSDLGLRLHYSVEDTPLGTAGSVKQAEELLREDTFVIVSGDALTDVNLPDAVAAHRGAGADATLILKKVPKPLEFGIVVTGPEGRIQRFLEKPSWGEVFSDTVNTGMYVLEPGVFDYMEAGASYDWSQDIFPRMLADGKLLLGHVMTGYWCDIGNLAQYREAQYDVLDGKTSVPLQTAEKDGVRIGEGSTIHDGAEVRAPSLVGRNVIVRPGAVVGPHAVVGDNCIIEDHATVERSILWDDVYVGSNSRLNACTVCSHTILQGECIVEEAAVIGDKCRIEAGALVRSGVKIWPDKNIEAGATVTMSLIWGHTWQGSLFGELGVSGIANREISPEFATRLGSAFGCFLKPGTTVLTARDSGRAARMVKRAVIAGLMSVGCNVEDLRSASLPIMRHSLRESPASGGVYVRLSPDDPRTLLVELLDADGVYLSTSAERKVESIFFREDWRRADAPDIGKLDLSGHSVEQYQEAYLRNLSVGPVYDRHWKVVVDFSFSRVASVFGGILGHLGCDVVALNAFGDPGRTPEKQTDRERLLADLSRTVRTLGADLGAMIEHDGERLAVVDERGRAVEGDQLLMLFAVLVARTEEGACIAVPVTATSRLEGMLALHHATVQRTRRDVRSLLAAAARSGEDRPPVVMAGDRSGGFTFPRFHNAFDAMFATGRLLQALTVTDLTVAEVVDGLPEVHVLHRRIGCPWQAKGRVMLEASGMAANAASADMTDGVRLVDGDAWTLVVPDASAPIVHVLAEDRSRDAAQERLDRMAGALEPVIREAWPLRGANGARSQDPNRA